MTNWFKALVCALLAASLVGCAGQHTQGALRNKAAEANLKLGVGYMQTGHFRVAEAKLKKALGYDEQYDEVHNALGVLYEEQGQDDFAERHYRRAVALNPDYTLAVINYGRFLCSRQRAPEGMEQLLAATTESDMAEDAYIAAGACARVLSDKQRAEQLLRQALDLDPNSVQALYELAELSHEQGKHLQARAFLQRYHALADYSPASLWLGIGIEEALGDSQLRRDYASLLLSRFVDSKEARRLMKPE